MRNLCPLAFALILVTFRVCNSVPLSDFYPYGKDAGDLQLSGADEGATNELELRTPFVFYGDTYFSLFINMNGIVSFLTEIPYFFNSQFPLDYPVIAPFYSDVDTKDAGTINYRETSDPTTLARISGDIRANFESGDSFKPKSVFIATWDGVVPYQKGFHQANTYQVVLATDRKDSYVLFNYADGGLQWIQGAGKTSGLDDAMAQAGLIGADGRMYTIRGSGTDQVRNLNIWSNVGKPGVWMFRVGRVSPGKNVQPPNRGLGLLDIQPIPSHYSDDTTSCSSGGSICHSSAICTDYETGFCCSCNEGYAGNGLNCLIDDKPIRVTGKLNGNINGKDITDADLHSYVLPADGRTYTAVSRIPKEVGFDLQSLTGIGEGIAWLFATPKEGVRNGFSMTGALFNRTVKVTFPQTGHSALIEQVFKGVDVFNNVAVDTKVTGSLPTVPIGSELEIDAFNEEFTQVKLGQLRAQSSRNFMLKGQSLETPYSVKTTLNFNECAHFHKDPRQDTLRMKVAENIFIRFDQAESIVRYSFSAKIGTLEEEDPCIKGRVECGPNSQCIVDGDNFRCVCEQGFDYVYDSSLQAAVCLDINECNTGRDSCHSEAVCLNGEGSYSCTCKAGYAGDGYYCSPEITCNNVGCDENASCREINQVPECECNIGYKGDGFFCTPDFGDDSCHIAQNCSPYAVCAPTASGYGCRCLQGYRGDGYHCEVDQIQPSDGYNQPPFENVDLGYPQAGQDPQPVHPSYHEPFPTLRPYDPFVQPDNSFDSAEAPQPECLFGECWCPEGYDYDQTERICKAIRGVPNIYEDSNNPLPVCIGGDSCLCPIGYLYNAIYGRCDEISEAPACNVVNNCHTNAHCMHDATTGDSHCNCNQGYVGDGFSCTSFDVSCDHVDVCHVDADCLFDDDQLRSVCVCKAGHSGDGRICNPTDDCNSGSDCDFNAQCMFDPSGQRYTCRCNEGFEGDGVVCIEDEIYTQEESCQTLKNCDPNADCTHDSYMQKYVCKCREGFYEDAGQCRQLETGCDQPCDQNAECVYDTIDLRFQCTCKTGYTGDGLRCHFADSCLNDPSLCHSNARCDRSSSDVYEFDCICVSGYVGDGFHCEKALDHEKNLLMINQGLSVLRMEINAPSGNGVPIHIDPYMTAVGADVDCLSGLYYWTDVGSQSIRSSKYNGANRMPVVTGVEVGSPEDVTVDWVSKNVYWTDSKNDLVKVADTEGSMIKTVVNGDLYNPRGITCHPGLGYLFWSDWNRDNPKIEKSGMDGSDRETLVSGTGISLPNSLAVDFETSTLCWADAGTHRIECIGIQGYGRRIIVDNVKYPFGLSLHKDSFFYTDWNDTRIHEVSKYTGEEKGSRDPPPGGSGRLYGIAVVPDQCPPASNVCQVNKGNCPDTHLCLPNGKGGRTCGCPNSASKDVCSDIYY